jgi:hypothetical protein
MVGKHTSRLIRHTALLIAAALACAGCDRAEPVDDRVSREHVHSPGCSNETIAVVSSSLRSQEFLNADLDGDDNQDSIYVVNDPEGERGCRAFLVVDGPKNIYSAQIDPSGEPRSMQIPTLNSLREIDGQSGTEVVINVEAGASTQFVKVFTLSTGLLKPLELDGKGPGPFAGEIGDLFAYGGSVGHLEAVDCTGDGRVVMSVALPKGSSSDSYEVERRFFSFRGTELVLDPDLNEKHTVKGLKIDDFPEFASSPFGSCG